MYTTSQVANMFGRSQKTITRWVEAFEERFSDPAKNTDGSQRRFNEDDLRVIALIRLMKAQGRTFELIRVSLAAGERAEPPELPTSITPVKPAGQQLALTARVTELENQLASSSGENRLLKEQLSAAQAEIKALNREIGRLEAGKDSE